MHADENNPRTGMPCLRQPLVTDGAAIWDLVRACKPLDENSMYCNLIQTDHFAETCVVAELDGEIVGWISGHIIPGQAVLFVWQVAVAQKMRGTGLARDMLADLVTRDICADIAGLKTTITKDNTASWRLFQSFARSIGASLSDQEHFTQDQHFGGHHATEHMVTITFPEPKRKAA
ncbi:diaminobutyrate acetyltransferase [Actibacterium sp.]|uniref:diaminobutyrate acetyltransferase n=1 Tax=Actibacterium sp. TaxID=1872125 RepID=UPI003569DFF6